MLKKLIADYAALQSENAVLKEELTQLLLFPGMQTLAVKKAEEKVSVPEHKRKKKTHA